MKFSICYFHIKTKILVDCQICISLPLRLEAILRLKIIIKNFAVFTVYVRTCKFNVLILKTCLKPEDKISKSLGLLLSERLRFFFV